MREEFEKLAVAGKIEGRHIEPLVQLATTGFCIHRSWGFGCIRTMDPVFARFTIDFVNKPGHTMDLGFATETLKPIPKEHIFARKATDPEALRQLAVANRLELIKIVLLSFEGRATVEQIQQILVPDIIHEDWRKWWESARRELKQSGHFLVPLKKSDPIVYQEEKRSLEDRLLGEFHAAKGLKSKIAVAGEILRNSNDINELDNIVAEVIRVLNGDIASHQRTQPALALEAIFMRDDLRDLTEESPAEGELTAHQFWVQETDPGLVLEQIPAAKQRRALEGFKAAYPDTWDQSLLNLLNTVSFKLCREFTSLLIQNGKIEALKETLATLIGHHTASSELLLWLGKDRSDAFADILGPEVLRAMLSAMERDQFNEKRSSRLREFILNDAELIGELTAAADIEVVKDLTRALQYSPVFDDMDKRALLARIVKSHAPIQSLITGEQPRQDTSFWVSWESLNRRREEYDELVRKKIPANSKEIAVARSYGDLSENHEYKAAKEMQKILMRRKEELEEQLVRARGTDFSQVVGDVVGPGTVVHTTDLTTGHTEIFTILGAWDSQPEAGVISYLTPVAQALLGRKPGEEVEFEWENTMRRHRIESVQPYRPQSVTDPTLVSNATEINPSVQPGSAPAA